MDEEQLFIHRCEVMHLMESGFFSTVGRYAGRALRRGGRMLAGGPANVVKPNVGNTTGTQKFGKRMFRLGADITKPGTSNANLAGKVVTGGVAAAGTGVAAGRMSKRQERPIKYSLF